MNHFRPETSLGPECEIVCLLKIAGGAFAGSKIGIVLTGRNEERNGREDRFMFVGAAKLIAYSL